jgi:hypothetical protein
MYFKLSLPIKQTEKTKSVTFSLQAIYTDRGTPLVSEVSANFCGWRTVVWSAQRVPTVINLGFLDRYLYL